MALVKALSLALFGSTLANLLMLILFGPMVIDQSNPLHALTVAPIAIFTVIGVLGAVIVYAAMRVFLRNPNRSFLIVAGIVLVLSFIPDLLIVGQTSGPFGGGNIGSAALLMTMHVATGAIVTWALIRLWGPRPQSMS